MLKSGVEIAERFTLTRRLVGSEAVPVWAAIDRQSSSPVVLKIESRAAPATLEAEYAASRGLSHPGIAAPLELVRSGEQVCLVQAMADSGDLGALRTQSYRVLLPHLQRLTRALGYLHSLGLVHGDLKPSNVLLDTQRGAQLSDFTNLRAVGAERAPATPYSPYTASPQQRATLPAQPSDDIYSFGALSAELLCGQPPGYAQGEPGARISA